MEALIDNLTSLLLFLKPFFTVILFLNSLFLVLLVLVQLPKKEAGLGTAFGGGTTDALFGAGAGNVLTKLTKWNAGIFLFLCLFLSMPFMTPKNLSETLGQNEESDTQTTPSPANGQNFPQVPATEKPSELQNPVAPTNTSNAPSPATTPKEGE